MELLENHGETGSNAALPPETPPTEPKPEKPTRTYAEIKAALKAEQGLVLTKEEGNVYFAGKNADIAAEKERDAAASSRFWGTCNLLFNNIVFKSIFFVVYSLWSIMPVIGIVIGFLYWTDDYCPPHTSIAPLLVTLGFMSILVSVSVVTRKTQETTKQKQGVTDPEQPAEALALQPSTSDAPAAPAPITLSPPQVASVSVAAAGACGCCLSCLPCFIVVLKLAHLTVFIVASFIVYGFWPNANMSKEGLTETQIEETYCHYILLPFAFWSITFSYIVLASLFFIACCGCASYITYMSFSDTSSD